MAGKTGKVIDAFWAAGEALVTMNCPTCAVHYALSKDFHALMKMGAGRSWFCPNGHSLIYPEHETALLRELREAKEAARTATADAAHQRSMREWAETRARGANVAAGKAKAAKQRLEKRIAAGVCPCCQRTFKQLAAHIKSKHPERVLEAAQ